jgi:hypothetical protein
LDFRGSSGDQAISATHPSKLDHEDLRRLRSEKTGFWPRTGDAIKFAFEARRDNGSVGFAYARFVSTLERVFSRTNCILTSLRREVCPTISRAVPCYSSVWAQLLPMC